MTLKQLVVGLLWAAMCTGGLARGEDLRSVAKSPFLIHDYVKAHPTLDAGNLWSALGIPRTISDPHETFDCQRDYPCKTWLQPLELSLECAELIAVRFTQPERRLNRFLVFCKRETSLEREPSWVLTGYIDSLFAKYFDPTLSQRDLGGQAWLVLREQSGGGTGFIEAAQRWFEMRDGHLNEVMSVLDDGEWNGFLGDFVVGRSAFVTDYRHDSNGYLFRVLYRLVYALPGLDDDVDRGFFGSVEKVAIYRRKPTEKTFQLDASSSGVTDDEIDKLFRSDYNPHLATDFLKNTFQDLLRIARGRKSVERDWLSKHIAEFPATAEQKEIARALGTQTRR